MYQAGGNVKDTINIKGKGPPQKNVAAFFNHTLQNFKGQTSSRGRGRGMICSRFHSHTLSYLKHFTPNIVLLQTFHCWLFISIKKNLAYARLNCTITTNGIGGSESADAISLSSLFFQPGTIAGEPYLSLRSFARSRYFNYEDHIIHLKCYHSQSCTILPQKPGPLEISLLQDFAKSTYTDAFP